MTKIALVLVAASLAAGCMNDGKVDPDANEPDAATWPAKIAGYWEIQFPDKGATQCGTTASLNFTISATIGLRGVMQLAVDGGALVNDSCQFTNVSADGSSADVSCVGNSDQFFASLSDDGQTAAVLVTTWNSSDCILDDSATGGHGAQATIVTRQR